jgi:CheY-like chemotaxis protein
MTDPISITGLLLTISHTVSVLYTYGRNVKDAKSDISELTNELLVLQGVLKQVQDRISSSTASVGTGKDSLYMLRSTKQSLELLLYKLETPSSKIGKMIQYAKWPLQKDEVSNHLKQFERLKSLLILVFLTENSEMIVDAIQSMKTALDKKLEGVDDLLLQQKDEELRYWLAPLSPEEEHGRISRKRQPGTRQWFLKEPFAEWINDQKSSVLWLLGKCK